MLEVAVVDRVEDDDVDDVDEVDEVDGEEGCVVLVGTHVE